MDTILTCVPDALVLGSLSVSSPRGLEDQCCNTTQRHSVTHCLSDSTLLRVPHYSGCLTPPCSLLRVSDSTLGPSLLTDVGLLGFQLVLGGEQSLGQADEDLGPVGRVVTSSSSASISSHSSPFPMAPPSSTILGFTSSWGNRVLSQY